MQSANNADRALRVGEVGHQWEEKLSGATGTVLVQELSTVRVRATGATTVTIDGVLAMTMSAGEIALFCVGKGDPANPPGMMVSVVIAAASAFVQVARNVDRTVDGQPI